MQIITHIFTILTPPTNLHKYLVQPSSSQNKHFSKQKSLTLSDLCNFCNWLFTPVHFLYIGWILFLIYIYFYCLSRKKSLTLSPKFLTEHSTSTPLKFWTTPNLAQRSKGWVTRLQKPLRGVVSALYKNSGKYPQSAKSCSVKSRFSKFKIESWGKCMQNCRTCLNL